MTNYNLNQRGSILIWTVMLGLLMTTVFFYAAIRYGNLSGRQQETIEYQSKKAFFNSYMDYLKENPSEIDGEKDFGREKISVKLTQTTNEITGTVESYGEETQVTYEDISGDADEDIIVKVEYNQCENGVQVENADIETDPAYTVAPAVQPCNGFEYGNYVNVTLAENDDLILTSLDAPFHYKITGTDLKDKKWHLTAEMRFGFGKKIVLKHDFID